MSDLTQQQIDLETKGIQEGNLRYEREQKRLQEDQGFEYRSVNQKIIEGSLDLVREELEVYLKLSSKKGKGRTEVALSYLRDLDVETLSLIALSCVFNSIGRSTTVAMCCAAAGRQVENELWAKGLQDRDSDLYDRLVERAMRTHGDIAYRKKAIRATAAKEGYKPDPLPSDIRARIGVPLVNAVLKACPELFQLVTWHGDKDTERRIAFTEEGSRFIASLTHLEAWMFPVLKPMLIKPRPWTDFDSGCYLGETVRRTVPLVRTYNKEHKKLIKEAIRHGLMQPCLEALNAIQDTAWRINKPMLEIVKWSWEQGVVLESFPQRFHLPKPAHPENWEELTAKKKKGWRIRVSQIAERNQGIDSERVVMLQDLATAEELYDKPKFFIPHSLDFRGRVYPVPHFNQQRADHIKSLLEFAEGVPLGEDGAFWLAVHLANCADFDKLSKKSLDDRVKWVTENHDLITKVANDFKGTFDIWSKADNPFQFVAACMDYVGFLKNGNDHVSHLPVALDGSNSGLQHYSAALRSPEGALVSLTPSEKPADVYQVVCDLAKSIVEEDAVKGDEIAKIVLTNGVTRSLVKRNVMTYAYSSEQFGFAQQLRSDVMKPLEFEVLEGRRASHPYATPRLNKNSDEMEPDNGFTASLYIASVVWRAVNEIVKDASQGMKFFQRCAQVLAHEGKGLFWVTPVGLPVLNKYPHWDIKTVQLFLYDKTVPIKSASGMDKIVGDDVLKCIKANMRVRPNDTINKAKAKSAIAPNVIHSMDAAHLMLTVLDAKYSDITSVSLIHDSFGTHAGNTTKFFVLIREAFVEMYEHYDPFEEIYHQTHKALEDKGKAPEVPARGNLDLSQVVNSLYAFA